MGEFFCSHFNIEDGRKYAMFSAYSALLFQEKIKRNWNIKQICAVYGEGAVIERARSGLWILVLRTSCWTTLHSQVDQLKLIAVKLGH